MLLDSYTYGQHSKPDPSPDLAYTPQWKAAAQTNSSISIALHDQSSSARSNLEHFIIGRFNDKHNATIREFMPLLIELRLHRKLAAVVGIRNSHERPFFLEAYLDAPIEGVLSALSNQQIEKHGIVEIGNLAAINARTGSLLITLLAKSLSAAGYQWMVFTATGEVEKMIAKLGCEKTVLSQAKQSMLIGPKSDWGSYYDNQPKVVACNLGTTIAKAESTLSLLKVIQSYSRQTHQLADALKSENQTGSEI